ncbi:MAG: hypothetical protein ACRDQ2_19845 [Gaiellales bacterium]
MFDLRLTLQETEELLDKAASNLEPELLSSAATRASLKRVARLERKCAYLKTALTPKVHDAAEIAQITGTSFTKAKETVATAAVLKQSDDLSTALQTGRVSFDQVTEIAKAEESVPGISKKLIIPVAQKETFQVLKDEVRKAKLEAEQHRDLAARQHGARNARNYVDDLGMVNMHLRWEPHVGTPIVNQAEAEAKRLHKAARKAGSKESFECHLADCLRKNARRQGKAVDDPARAGRCREPRGRQARLD